MTAGPAAPDRAAGTEPAPARSVRVLTPGPLSTVQDLGRPGLSHLGVGVSGAADGAAMRLANRLVGNPESAAAVEVTFGGLAIRAQGTVTVALTGAPTPARVLRAGAARPRPVGTHCALVLADSDELWLGTPERGLRTYLAVRGGIDVAPVLGSRSTDLLARLGPDPLAAGRVLALGPVPATQVPSLDLAPVTAPPGELTTLRAIPGPRDDWFTVEAMRGLFRDTWEVHSDSNRVGVRLTGPPLVRRPERRGAELPSEGVVRGSVQVPPSGTPIVFLADHPVTGGYPVAAVLLARDVDLAAQAGPGHRVRFHPATR